MLQGTSSSNGLPFVVTNGVYAASCPASPSDSQFQIVTASLNNATVNRAYSVSLEATGGTQPYTWASVGNALPLGLSFSSSDVISGTPTTATTTPINLTIQATDANQLTTQALLPISIGSQATTAGTIYSYSVPSGKYDGVGNLLQYSDSVMGTWNFSYDTLNRLASGNASSGDFDGQYGCWNYDSFGNRKQQMFSSQSFQSGSGGASPCAPQASATIATNLSNYNNDNQITITNARGLTFIPSYDGAGNIETDGVNSYLYDAEGRICAVEYNVSVAGPTFTGYLYNAEGQRIAKGSLTSLSCNLSSNGFQLREQYVLGQSGGEVAMLDGSGNWQRSEVYGAGKHLATYDAEGLHFQITDPLGNRRVQTNSTGVMELTCENLPFGDQLNCFAVPGAPSTAEDSTPLHFTGKERDAESGNDYFGARYYASSMGRFMSPDWSEAPDTIPYGNLQNPQSLNLYAYVNNNPLTETDDDGHVPCGGSATITIVVNGNGSSSMSQSGDDCPNGLSLWQQFSNWRQNQANAWNQRIEAHRPPQGPTNDLKAIQDTTDIMMGVGPVLAYGRFGWRNGPKWRQAVKELMKPGTHEKIAGEVPTREQATMMIEENGGTISRGGAGKPMDPGEEFGHDPGGVSDHTYPHINYETPSGMKATIKVQP